MGFCSCRESKIHTRERHFAGATYNEQDAADYRRERDGRGVACVHVLLGELADRIGLTAALSEATDGLRQRRTGRDPGRVLVDVAVAIADGATTISDVQALSDQHGLHGPAGSVASTPTIWRVLAGIDAPMRLSALERGAARGS